MQRPCTWVEHGKDCNAGWKTGLEWQVGVRPFQVHSTTFSTLSKYSVNIPVCPGSFWSLHPIQPSILAKPSLITWDVYLTLTERAFSDLRIPVFTICSSCVCVCVYICKINESSNAKASYIWRLTTESMFNSKSLMSLSEFSFPALSSTP